MDNSHCVGADGGGFVEVTLGEKQVQRHTFPGLVHVPHAEKCLRRQKLRSKLKMKFEVGVEKEKGRKHT